MKAALIFLLLLTSLRAEDWTVDGKTYQHVVVTQVDDDKVHITFDGGIGSVPLSDLTPDLQKKFDYDPAKAKAAQDAAEKHQVEADAQTAREIAANKAEAFNDEIATNPAPENHPARWFFYGKVIAINTDGMVVDCTGPEIRSQPNATGQSKIIGYWEAALPPKGLLQITGRCFIKNHPHQFQVIEGDTVSGSVNLDGIYVRSGKTFISYTTISGDICTDTAIVSAKP